MSMVWTGKSRWAKDGFDETGVRVAFVGRYSDPIPDTLGHYRYWMAFVRQPDFEPVLVDGAPGHWASEAEARVAAEEAFSTWLAEAGDRSALPRTASSPPEPLSFGKQLRMVAKGLAVTSWPFRSRRRAPR